MKTKTLIASAAILALSMISFSNANAQMPAEKSWKGTTYLYLGYSQPTITNVEGLGDWLDIQSTVGAALTMGHTFYLHREPIANAFKFGIDWDFLDVNAALYNRDGGARIGEVELGMAIGPSLTFSPANKLKFSAYGRIAPSLSGLAIEKANDSDSNRGYVGYATYYKGGVTLSYRAISFGAEYRLGKANDCGDAENTYNKVVNGEESESISDASFSTEGLRFFFGFRF